MPIAMPDSAGHSPRHGARSQGGALGVAVRERAARRDRCAFRREAAREAEDLERPRAARPRRRYLRRPADRRVYFETDFASFLAWRDWGFPDRGVFNGFGMGALRCCRRRLRAGRDGRPYRQCRARSISRPARPIPTMSSTARSIIAGSVAREIEEETGLTPADYHPDAALGLRRVGALDRADAAADGRHAGRGAEGADRGQSGAAEHPELPRFIWCAARSI